LSSIKTIPNSRILKKREVMTNVGILKHKHSVFAEWKVPFFSLLKGEIGDFYLISRINEGSEEE
jgi:hypothetical protein